MAKITALFLMSLLLLCAVLSCSARPEPVFPDVTPVETKRVDVEMKRENEFSDESCEGADEEECLVRRTLVAHVDYIYTQKHHP